MDQVIILLCAGLVVSLLGIAHLYMALVATDISLEKAEHDLRASERRVTRLTFENLRTMSLYEDLSLHLRDLCEPYSEHNGLLGS